MKKKINLFLYILIVLLFLLLSFDFYLSKKYYPPSSDEFLANPAKYGGMQSEFTGTFINSSEDSFYLRVNQKPIKVYYSGFKKPELGQVYLLVELNKDGTAKALEVHKMSYNYLKYFISLIGLIIFLVIFFKEWKFKKGRFVENA